MSSLIPNLFSLKRKPSFQDLPLPTTTTLTPRPISLLFPSHPTPEGSGVLVRRSIGSPTLRTLSPFLMLDHALVPTTGSFPDHPHRGITTVSYILSGSVWHEDFAGNSGVLHAGDLQFMTAGRGIVHSEMPIPSASAHGNNGEADGNRGEEEQNEGLQLWIDLPTELKMCEPRYRDVRGSEIPVVEKDGVKVKVISGVSHGVQSLPALAATPVWYLDFTLQPGSTVRQGIPSGWNAFLYVMSGSLNVVGGQKGEWRMAKAHDLVVFEREGGDCFEASVGMGGGEKETRFIFVAGLPLEQSVVQYGPFVMTTREEIVQARMDWARYENGFERARNWESQALRRRRSLC